MNRSEKIKYLESLLSGEINLIHDKEKFIWFTPDGIRYSETDIGAKDGISITEEQFVNINSEKDLIFISGIAMPLFKLKGSVKVFTENLHPDFMETVIKSLTPGAEPNFEDLFGKIE